MTRSRPGRGKGRLPAETTAFVDREIHVAEVKRLLSVARLVTLTGVGGAGKTRLATRVAADLRSRSPVRRVGAVRGAGGGRGVRLRADPGERGRGGGHLHPARRVAAGHRAGRRAAADAYDRPARQRARQRLPAAHRPPRDAPAPPDPEGDLRLELHPVLARGTGTVGPAVRVPPELLDRGRRVRVRRGPAPAPGDRAALRTARQVRPGPRGGGRARAVPAAGDRAPGRPGAAGHRHGRPVPPAPRLVPGAGPAGPGGGVRPPPARVVWGRPPP